MPPKKSLKRKATATSTISRNQQSLEKEPESGFVLGPDATLDIPPEGLRFVPFPYTLAFLHAARKIERERGVKISITNPAEEPFNRFGNIAKGDLLHISTNRAFYCDPFETSEVAIGIVALICSGNPLEAPRQLIPGVTLISHREVLDTNLIIVPAEFFDHWRDCLRCSFLEVHYVQTINDLAAFREGDGMPKKHVILLSSKIWPSFNKMFKKKNITWPRIIIQEHEGNSIDKQPFDIRTEFTWHLTSTPAAWIQRAESMDRFRAVGVYEENPIHPALFYVRNKPKVIEYAHSSTVPRSLYTGSEEFLQRAGPCILKHSMNQRKLQNDVTFLDESFRKKYSRELEDLNRASYQRFCATRLEMASVIASVMANGGSKELIEKITHKTDVLIGELAKTQTEHLIESRKEFESATAELGRKFITESKANEDAAREELQSIIDSVHRGELKPSVMPYRLLDVASSPFTPEKLENLCQSLETDHCLVHGCVNVAEILLPNAKPVEKYIAISLAPGIRIRAILSTGEPHLAVISTKKLEDSDPAESKSYYEKAFIPALGNVCIDQLLIEDGSTFVLYRDTPCLVEYDGMIVQGTVCAEADILIN